MRNKNIYSSIVAAVYSWGNEKELTKGEAINLLQYCISEGISSFKCRKTEEEGLQQKAFGLAISESGLDREEIQIILELKEIGASTFSKQKILDLVEESMLNLKIDYLDLLLIDKSFTSEVKESVDQLKSQERIREVGFSEVKNWKDFQKAENFQAVEMKFEDFIKSNDNLNAEEQKADIFISDFSPNNVKNNMLSSNSEEMLAELSLNYRINQYQLLLAWIYMYSPQAHIVVEGSNGTKWNKSVAAKDIDLTEADFFRIKKALKIEGFNE